MQTRILIADDDPAQRRFVAAMLTSIGHLPESAAGGEAALARLFDRDAPAIGVLLLDLNMPDLDGISVLNRLRAAGLALPVLVLTSDGSIARAVEAMSAGANDFLVKPVGPERLEVSLANALVLSSLSSARCGARHSRGLDRQLSFDDGVVKLEADPASTTVARPSPLGAASLTARNSPRADRRS